MIKMPITFHFCLAIVVASGCVAEARAATMISAGENHSFFLRNNGSVWGAGWNITGALGDKTLELR
ncbi:MAG: hypothetical protein ACPGVU_14615, partial [Limisphaerales bacterium]